MTCSRTAYTYTTYTHTTYTHTTYTHTTYTQLYAYAAAGFGIAGGAVDFSTVLT